MIKVSYEYFFRYGHINEYGDATHGYGYDNPYKPYHIWCPHKHKTMPIKRFDKFRGATDIKVEMFGK